MKYTYKRALSSAPKLITASMLSIVLVACGGGTSGDGTLDTGSLDAEGSVDLDGGLDAGGFEELGLDENGSVDAGGENGFVIGDEIDSDTPPNGISDANEIAICKGFTGTDEDSSTFEWMDNCEVRHQFSRNDVVFNHPFYQSTYAKGIQRVLYCSGHGGTATSTDDFADADFRGGTSEAVRAFQLAEGLAVDGIVGEDTWSRLQSKVEPAFISLESDADGNQYEVFGVIAAAAPSTVDCSDEANFLGTISETTLELDGWRLTTTPGEFGVGPFSIGF